MSLMAVNQPISRIASNTKNRSLITNDASASIVVHGVDLYQGSLEALMFESNGKPLLLSRLPLDLPL